MKEEIIKWIEGNAADIRHAVITLVIMNFVLFGMCMISGQFIWLFLHLINIVFADIFMVIPMVYVVKLIKECK